LREKKVPKVRWKGHINAGQDCQEVVLECVHSVLRPIAVMHVRRDKLKVAFHLKVIASLQAEQASLSRI
jgi:hypothetical protein